MLVHEPDPSVGNIERGNASSSWVSGDTYVAPAPNPPSEAGSESGRIEPAGHRSRPKLPTGSNVFHDARAISVPVTHLAGRPWWMEALARVPESLRSMRGRVRMPRIGRPRPLTLPAAGGGIAIGMDALRAMPRAAKWCAVAIVLVASAALALPGGSHPSRSASAQVRQKPGVRQVTSPVQGQRTTASAVAVPSVPARPRTGAPAAVDAPPRHRSGRDGRRSVRRAGPRQTGATTSRPRRRHAAMTSRSAAAAPPATAPAVTMTQPAQQPSQSATAATAPQVPSPVPQHAVSSPPQQKKSSEFSFEQ